MVLGLEQGNQNPLPFVLITAMLTGTMREGLAVPDKLVTGMLRGSLK